MRACVRAQAHICGSGCFSTARAQPSVAKVSPCSGATHLRPTASGILALLSNDGPVRQNTHSHSQDDNVCLVLLSAGVHVNSAVTKTPALKGGAAPPLAGETRAFILIPCGRVFRAALIRLCHHMKGLTGGANGG